MLAAFGLAALLRKGVLGLMYAVSTLGAPPRHGSDPGRRGAGNTEQGTRTMVGPTALRENGILGP